MGKKSTVSIHSIFRSLQHRNFRLYYVGQSISLIGTWMQRIAISWLVYNITHSALMLGLVTFASLIPTLFLSPYGGTLSDRHSRYKILLITQIASMIQAALMAALVLTDNYSNAAVIALSALLGIINAFDIPSRQSLLVELVEKQEDLPNAIALNSTMVNLAKLIGPVVAGLLLTTVGEGMCFLLNALSFIGVLACLLMMKIPHRVVSKSSENVWTSLQKGYTYLKEAAELRTMILLMACISFFVMPYYTLLPVFAKDVFQGTSGTYSWLNSISGLGSLIGAAYLAGRTQKSNLSKIILYTAGIFCLSLVLFSFSTWLPISSFLLMTTGFGLMLQIACTNTFVQTHVDDHMRGRMLSYYVMAFQGMQPIGSFLIGFTAQHLGAQLTVMLQGLLGIVVVALFALRIKNSTSKEAVSKQ